MHGRTTTSGVFAVSRCQFPCHVPGSERQSDDGELLPGGTGGVTPPSGGGVCGEIGRPIALGSCVVSIPQAPDGDGATAGKRGNDVGGGAVGVSGSERRICARRSACTHAAAFAGSTPSTIQGGSAPGGVRGTGGKGSSN